MIAPGVGVTAVVPAAGASRRFGGAKLLADVAGEPLLQHTLRSLLDGGVSRVILVAAAGHGLHVVPLVHDTRVRISINPDPERGMFSSIQAGLAGVDAGQTVLVLPADMPFVRAETVALVMAAHSHGGGAVVATHAARRGHPLIIPAEAWPHLLGLPAGTNLKAALVNGGVSVREAIVDDPGVVRDIDVPADLG
jgi:molybdenum cofactor cytidylyltransferase